MIQANYFDGKSATRHTVTLSVQGDRARIEGDGIVRDEALASLRVSEPMGSAPRLITFADGAICEISDHAALNELLAQTGYREKSVVRWQQSGTWVLAMLLFSIALIWLGYRYALPVFANVVAQHLPEKSIAQLGQHILEALDESVFKPSELPKDRQKQLIDDFEKLPPPAGKKVNHTVHFRKSPQIGANAFALPSGDIVMTDELVALANDDREILGVLAHELGHLEKRHSLRQLLQGTAVGLVISWYVGDISSILASAPAAMLEARYSRDFEREADEYGAALLKHNNISPSYLANMLEHLEKFHNKESSAKDDEGKDYFSTHPGTQERVRVLREQ
jgi:Zn-dependent protease with chaperone function